jgi:hypothetical protein
MSKKETDVSEPQQITTRFQKVYIPDITTPTIPNFVHIPKKKMIFSILESGSEVELHAAATIESWKIILIVLDDNCEKIGETVFDSKTSSKTVELLKLNDFYGLKL